LELILNSGIAHCSFRGILKGFSLPSLVVFSPTHPTPFILRLFWVRL
jgi:hypothetical protein